MPYYAKVLKDSVGPNGKRLTTFELSFPRFVLAELNTHRLFSRNAASSRAIPVERMLKQVEEDPAMPVWWGKNQKGMQAGEELNGRELEKAKENWLAARDHAVHAARILSGFGLHKQVANRVVEPWMFSRVILSATELDGWFRLRDSEQAQPEIAWVAREMRSIIGESKPQKLKAGEWHIPMVDDDTGDVDFLKKVSVGRCGRVSYLTHDGKRDTKEDVDLHDRMLRDGHFSPFEHVAMALAEPTHCGNFFGWRQYRADVDPNFVSLECPACGVPPEMAGGE